MYFDENLQEKMNEGIDDPVAQSYILPWDRIMARGIDTSMCSIIIIAYFGYIIDPMDDMVLKIYGPSEGGWLLISGLLAFKLCVFLFYEIFFLTLFSTTPGKALLGLWLREQDGRGLSFYSTLSRTIRVCGYLFLFFIPIVSLMIPISCLAHLHNYKNKAGKFIWDRSDRWFVTHEYVSLLFKSFIGALLLTFIFINLYLFKYSLRGVFQILFWI